MLSNQNIILKQSGIFNVNTWIYRLFENYVMIIDPDFNSFTGDENSFLEFLKKENLIPYAVILTHGHFDHIAGTRILKENFPDIQIAVHKEDAYMCGKEAWKVQSRDLDYMGLFPFISSLKNLPDADCFLENDKKLSDILSKNANFDDEKSQNIEKALKRWKIHHTPGHTRGSCCLYNEEEKILFSGDTVFYHSYGRTDLTDGDENQMIKSLLRLKKEIQSDTKVYPGHDYYDFTFEEGFCF